MCGRFTLAHSTEEVAERFKVQQVLFEAQPRYNIAPSQPIAVVTQEPEDGARCLKGYQWGLIPFWAKDPAIGHKMINARAETLAEKSAFKPALKRRRCIIPADGFYEWKTLNDGAQDAAANGKKKKAARQPMRIGLQDNQLFGFAGLWDEWHTPDGSPVRTCTIITTTPNDLMTSIHDRMPAILRPEDEDTWLSTLEADVKELLSLLRPYPDAPMAAHSVAKLVNSPAYDAPDCIAPVEGD